MAKRAKRLRAMRYQQAQLAEYRDGIDYYGRSAYVRAGIGNGSTRSFWNRVYGATNPNRRIYVNDPNRPRDDAGGTYRVIWRENGSEYFRDFMPYERDKASLWVARWGGEIVFLAGKAADRR